jgi:isopentenyldiphosphate isomerase
MWFKEREDTTLYVQCHIRAWFARRRANNLRKIRDEKDAELRRKQEELRLEEERKRKEEIERRMHPKKPKDFDILYNELEAWRLNETKKIRNSTELNVEEKNLAL